MNTYRGKKKQQQQHCIMLQTHLQVRDAYIIHVKIILFRTLVKLLFTLIHDGNDVQERQEEDIKKRGKKRD